MIYSDDKKFIFIKSNKTAGTSVEIALSRAISFGSDAIVSPISPEDEVTRLRLGGCSPQNCYREIGWPFGRDLRPSLSASYHGVRGLPGFLNGLTDFLRGKQSAEGFLEAAFQYRNDLMRPMVSFRNHISASKVRALLGDPLYFSCYRFGFTRDPVKRALSHYTWNQFEEPEFARRSLDDHREAFQEHVVTRYSSTQKFFCDPVSKEMIVDDVFRFEDLDGALHSVCQRLGLNVDEMFPLPRAKSGYGQALLSFRREDIVDARAKGLIRDRCPWEYDHFNYN